jgi:hypothetical protein
MSNTPRTDAIRTCQCSPHMPGGWVPAHKYEEMESELTTAIEQRDRLAVALDVCLREMLDVIYACNEEIVDANDTFHQAIKLGQKTLDDVKGGSNE